jgi:hypothetical protein
LFVVGPADHEQSTAVIMNVTVTEYTRSVNGVSLPID